MGMVIGDNFNYQGKKPLDSRMLFDTIADMKAYNENYLPDITLAFNKADGKMYVFNRTNDVDETTGKWREFEGGATPEAVPEVSTVAELTTYLESLTDTDYHKVNLTADIRFPATSLTVSLESSVYAVQRRNNNNIFAFKNEKIYKFNKANNARTVSEVTNEYMKSDVYELEMDTAYTVEDFFDEVSISVRNHSDVIYVDQYGTGTLTTTDGTEIAGEFHMILDAGNDNGIRGGKIYQFNEDGEYVEQYNVMVDVAEGTINVIKNTESVLTHKMKGYRSYGNCYTNSPTTSTRANSRKSLHAAIHLPAGVLITAKTGYQFGIYRNTVEQETGEYFNIGNGWLASYTTPAENDYYFCFMNVSGGENKINIDATIEDMLDMEDYSPFYEDVLETPSPWKGKTVAFIGDSITAGSGTTVGQRYCDYLADWMGVRRKYVDGISGSCISKTSDYGTSPTPLSMRYQNTPISDLIVVFMGTNDYGHGTPIGYFEDFDGVNDISFYSACRKSLGELQGNYGGRLVVMTPLHRKQLIVDGQVTHPTDDTPNAQGNTLQDYVDALKDVCRQYSIPVIDLYAMSSFTPRTQHQYEEYTTDGLHPNEGGHYMIAREILPILNNFAFGPNDNQKTMQRKVLPTASAIQLGKIIQYTGTTTSTLTNGYFYKCVEGSTTGTYKWQNIDVQAEADSSNVSYRGMSVEQALDEEFKPVENLITDNTKIVDGFWFKENGTCRINTTSIPEFQSFYIPVEEGKTYYTAAKMSALWIAFLDEDEQCIDAFMASGTSITIPTGQDIKYLSYPIRQAHKPTLLITEKPAEFVGELDVYRMTSAGEQKMQWPSPRNNGNYYATDTAFTEGTPVWCADYVYNLEDSIIGIGLGSPILGVNTQDKTVVALGLGDNKIYIFDIANNTFIEGVSPVTIPTEWGKDVNHHKTPSGLHGAVRVDDENNYILRAEGLSDLIIPKSAIKTRVESQSKVFENYTTASGMVWYNFSTAYKNMGVFAARHRGPIVEKKSTDISNHWFGKSWYAYGTSMTDTALNGYTVELQSLLGANLTNYGKGGSGIIPSLHGGTSGDNTYTRVKNITDGKTNADLITLEIIPNDMSGTLGTPTDNYADGTTETFCGCLNELLQYLQVNTNAQIVVLIATRSRYNYQDPTELYPPESQKATDWLAWTDAAKECCRRNCVPFIDGQSNCGLGYARVKDGTKYVRDQIHLTPLGAKNLGQYFYSQIKNIPLFYSE